MRYWLLFLTLSAFVYAFGHEDHEIFRLRDAILKHEPAGTSFYDFVGVSPSAGLDEINKAYRMRSRTWHPDKNKGIKFANERFSQLGVVVDILRSARRDRYDHFLRNGFPLWRGTGYYYSRFRPGLISVLISLYLVAGLGHYIALRLTVKEDRKRMRRYISEVRLATGIVANGQNRKVQSADGKVFLVNDEQEVYLVDGNDERWLLDVSEISTPTIKDTLIVRMPLWLWSISLGRLINPAKAHVTGTDAEERSSDSDDDENSEQKAHSKKRSGTTTEARVLDSGRKVASASPGPNGRRRKARK